MNIPQTITQSTKTYAAILCLTLGTSTHAQAPENPIDCEILLCMAAGFPAASGCGPAYNEVIDRVTPWPIEPPLQIWNCPMDIPKEYGNYEIDLGSPEYAFATSFKVFEIDIWHRRRDNDTCRRSSTVNMGTYDNTGSFSWDRLDPDDYPPQLGIETTGCRQRLRAIFIEWTDEAGTPSQQMIPY